MTFLGCLIATNTTLGKFKELRIDLKEHVRKVTWSYFVHGTVVSGRKLKLITCC